MTGGIEAEVEIEVLFVVILQFFTFKDAVVADINGHQLTVSIGGVEAFRRAINSKAGAVCSRTGNGRFQLQRRTVHHPYRTLFPDAGDVNRVGFFIHRQLARAERTYRVRAFTRIQHHAAFNNASFGVYRRYATVCGVAEPQCLRAAIERCTKRF